ncbi:glucose-1-phosphate cytidylyltransferase RfbF [Methyloglobulus morosus KoM1]|uniref:Glucose-1-phosphate cytidylyltransferase RfbF n=1 Tax=Methyloglobulus morosus KoM1 TaxID=1116472 RepID=V5DFI5_9GAMM|nr:sugar phosphate nucleotidyltransferase [Methyloglobulus morosus]ESS66176.1 glucose-1-phosphate cytidylyltransferase RfbF [Methyloglobulus morosus KoM1]
MKVVLFCGGLGTRLRDQSGEIPKPMVKIGYRPILWHVMKYYAYYGHKDFILCLGYRADAIKEFFLNYNEWVTNDFTLENGGKDIFLQQSDISDWRITCVDTGINSNIGQRLKAVQKYLEGEDYFLANYSDGLSDLPLPEMINAFKKGGQIGSFLCVKPSQSFSVVSLTENDRVEKIEFVQETNFYINGGYFVFRKELFNYMKDGEELVCEPFERLIAENKLMGYKYDKFWHCMDTFKEQKQLNEMYEKGNAPWEVWK